VDGRLRTRFAAKVDRSGAPPLAAPVGTAIPLGVVAIGLVLADRMSQADVFDIWTERPWGTAVAAGLCCLAACARRVVRCSRLRTALDVEIALALVGGEAAGQAVSGDLLEVVEAQGPDAHLAVVAGGHEL
jgi:hypothetical protein